MIALSLAIFSGCWMIAGSLEKVADVIMELCDTKFKDEDTAYETLAIDEVKEHE